MVGGNQMLQLALAAGSENLAGNKAQSERSRSVGIV